MISYEKFWNTLQRKNITQYVLVKKYKVSTGLLARMRNDEPVSLATIDKLCNILHCRIGDIVEITPDTPQKRRLRDDKTEIFV